AAGGCGGARGGGGGRGRRLAVQGQGLTGVRGPDDPAAPSSRNGGNGYGPLPPFTRRRAAPNPALTGPVAHPTSQISILLTTHADIQMVKRRGRRGPGVPIIPGRIRQARTERGLSLAELAGAEVSRAFIH